MTNVITRRGFLGHVGGAFAATAIVGGTAVAVSDLRNMQALNTYRAWLEMEGRMLGLEMYPELGDAADRYVPDDKLAYRFHFPPGVGWQNAPKPSTRASLILSTIGLQV